MKKLRNVVPWIFWIVVILALTISGTRNNATAIGTTNPRSYERAARRSSNPCP